MKYRFSSALLSLMFLLFCVGLTLSGCGSGGSGHIDIPTMSPVVTPTLSPVITPTSSATVNPLSPSEAPRVPSQLPPLVNHRTAVSRIPGTTIELAQGWNMISFPYAELTSVTGLEYQLCFYNGLDYAYLDPVADPEKVDTTLAYWAYSETASSITVTGQENDGQLNEIVLSAGWNLIGCPSTKSLSTSVMTVSRQAGVTKLLRDAAAQSINPGEAWIYRIVMKYSGNIPSMVDLAGLNSSLGTGCGHWVFAWGECTLNLNVVKPDVVPNIVSVSKNVVDAGDSVVVSGEGFGELATGFMSINGVSVVGDSIQSWTDSEINVTIPQGASSGDLVVFVNRYPSNAVAITVNDAGSGGTELSLTGKVQDRSTMQPLAGAFISVDTGQSAVSAYNGEFEIYDVPAGEHIVYVVLIGYKTAVGMVTVVPGVTRTSLIELSSTVSGGGGGTTGGDDAEIQAPLTINASAKEEDDIWHGVYKIQVSEQGNYSNRWSKEWTTYERYREFTVNEAIVGRYYNVKVTWVGNDSSEHVGMSSVKLSNDKGQTHDVTSW